MSALPLNPALFHLDKDHLWVMHCSEGPVPRAGMRVARAFMQKELQPWEVRWEEDFQGIPAALRAEAAALLGGRPEDISLCPTTSSGLVTVAQGFPWEPGDDVLAPLGEFPSNAWPWLALRSRGVRFREVPLWEGHRAGAEAWASEPPGPIRIQRLDSSRLSAPVPGSWPCPGCASRMASSWTFSGWEPHARTGKSISWWMASRLRAPCR